MANVKNMKFEERIGPIHITEKTIKQALEFIIEKDVDGDAFFLLSVDDVIEKYVDWTRKLPRIHPYYAVKCNTNPVVLRVLASLGTGFDCASKVEMAKVLDLGVDTSKIIFANPAKQKSHIRYALSSGIDLMTFDNWDELQKIKLVYPTARLVLRFQYNAKDAILSMGEVFGAKISDAESLIRFARELNLNIIGVCFHVGSGCINPNVYKEAIATARSIFDIGKDLGFNFNLLDIGGGFPGHTGSSIDKFADVIKAALEIHFPDDEKVRVIAEPGRYFVSSAFTLAASVHSRRRNEQPQGDTNFIYYINDGIFGTFGELPFSKGSCTPIILNEDCEGSKLYTGSIVGPSCTGVDFVTTSASLPKFELGQWLAFPDRGAYSLALASEFNGMPIPRVIAVCTNKTRHDLREKIPSTQIQFVEFEKYQQM